MELSKPNLEMLPTEIIQKIVLLLPVSSALSFSSTNSTIRAATNHWRIFKALISNDFHTCHCGASWGWVFSESLQEIQDLEFWKRYALADQKAVELFNNPGIAKGPKLAAWVPQLVLQRRESNVSMPSSMALS